MYSQKSRKYNREINYLNRLSSLVALMPTLRAGFSLLMESDSKKRSWVQLLFLSKIRVFSAIAELI